MDKIWLEDRIWLFCLLIQVDQKFKVPFHKIILVLDKESGEFIGAYIIILRFFLISNIEL